MRSVFFLLVVLVVFYLAAAEVAPCACPRNYDPVCASDGETYVNECLFECAHKVHRSLTILRAGPCDNFVADHYVELPQV